MALTDLMRQRQSRRRKCLPVILMTLISLIGVVSLPGCSQNVENQTLAAARPERFKAPELSGGVGWLNTDHPITLKELKGKVVLLDFWTFCCINCMHIIPTLKALEAKYPNQLVVIGVHSAKFENEKDKENIKKAILRYGVKHPVVDDADFKIWDAFSVHAWPTLIIIDPAGNIVGRTAGEESLASLEQEIQPVIDDFSKTGELNTRPLEFAPEALKAKATELAFPGKIKAASDGKSLFISDSGHNRILRVDLSGRVLDQIGSGKTGLEDGYFTRASFDHPQGVEPVGDKLYIADTENHCIRCADLQSKKVTTVAGTGRQAPSGAHGGKGKATRLSSPWDLTVSKGQLFIAMAGAHQIWEMNLKTGELFPFAGSGREGISDASLRSAMLAQPSGITAHGDKLYFVDSEASAVREASSDQGGAVKTIVGEGLFVFGDRDGKGKNARLQHPLGITFHDGKLYIADSYNHKIKSVDPETDEVKTLFGTGKPGFEDGEPAKFSEPAGLTFAGDRLYIADTNNGKIRCADLKSGKVTTLSVTGASELKLE